MFAVVTRPELLRRWSICSVAPGVSVGRQTLLQVHIQGSVIQSVTRHQRRIYLGHECDRERNTHPRINPVMAMSGGAWVARPTTKIIQVEFLSTVSERTAPCGVLHTAIIVLERPRDVIGRALRNSALC